MRTIGLLGGTSWPSTIDYYRILNRMAAERFGGFHSARLLLMNIDYHEIKRRYTLENGWDEIPELLGGELRKLAALDPACIVICNNTLHKAYDFIADSLELGRPVFHAVDETAREAKRRDARNVLLLGTQFTMEDGFYQRRLERSGLRVTIPAAAERRIIQHQQSRLAAGELDNGIGDALSALLHGYVGRVQAVVLACTELPLAITPQTSPLPIVNPTQCQCEAAFRFACEDD